MNIDLHRHLGGSIKPETIWKILQRDSAGQCVVDSLDDLYRMMTFRDDNNYKFHHFLSKFQVMSYVRWDEEAIDIAVEQVCRDLRDEGVEYCELRFSIDKYLVYIPWDEQQACLYVLDRIKYWADFYGVDVAPILSIKHECPHVYAKRISKLVHHWRIAEQVVGLDFVGNESMFAKKRIKDCFRHWRLCGKGLLLHAGEFGGLEHVRYAVDVLKPTRIAHGIHIVQDPDLLRKAVDHGMVFDVAIVSNKMTGVAKVENHPIVKMWNAGATITVGTDDPSTFDITLKDEFDHVRAAFGDDFYGEEGIEGILTNNSWEHKLQN